MEEEIEDIVGDVKYTDSQKSVATSNVYSLDFTDSSSEKHNSSGRETYVIEWDNSEDSDPLSFDNNRTVVSFDTIVVQPEQKNQTTELEEVFNRNIRSQSTSLSRCSIFAQETFTQTSKTIIELAQNEINANRPHNSSTLETQTSFISITENKTINYTIEISGGNTAFSRTELNNVDNERLDAVAYNQVFNNSLEDGSSKFPVSETENDKSGDCSSEISSDEKIIKILDRESKDNMLSSDEHGEERYENTSDFDSSTDMEEDSLMECAGLNLSQKNSLTDTPKSVDNEVAELYNKLSESIEMRTAKMYDESNKTLLGTLTPLTEESTIKKESLVDITPDRNIITINDEDKDVLFTNNSGMKVKMFAMDRDCDSFKLPPIQVNSIPNSPNLNFLFTLNPGKQSQRALPCVPEKGRMPDRWEIGARELASGESPLISGRSDPSRNHPNFQLPPIHCEGPTNVDKSESRASNISKAKTLVTRQQHSPINIRNRIKELKMNGRSNRHWNNSNLNTTSESRSGSPTTVSMDDSRLCDAAERGCDALCVELLRRLRSQSWFEIADTLAELPQAMEKFWCVISETRIADLIRQVSLHVESPRTQVARNACTALAAILKNTNYTKKPDFYEAVTTLLTKTGSFSRPVRRAANVALDEVACGVELSQAISALCIHGASHKSPLVRCASARLLVVCCALGGGGREVLRARPPTAAAARKHALRALANLLEDKNTDARKYAERLYSMLRPQANFEAYYLTDVEVELASRQMRKFDQLLSAPGTGR